MDSIRGNGNRGKFREISTRASTALYNQTLLANIFQRHSHYETSHFARNSAIFCFPTMFRVCGLRSGRWIGRRLFICSRPLDRANQSMGPAFHNSKRAFVHGTWQCTAPVYPVRATFHTGCTRPDWFSNQGNLCTAYYRRALMHPSKGGAVFRVFFYWTAYAPVPPTIQSYSLSQLPILNSYCFLFRV